jgi:hypothetical protein
VYHLVRGIGGAIEVIIEALDGWGIDLRVLDESIDTITWPQARIAAGHGSPVWCLGGGCQWLGRGLGQQYHPLPSGGWRFGSTDRWLCPWKSVVAAGGGSTGGTIGGGAAGAPSRAAPLPGPAAVLSTRTQSADSGCRPVDAVEPWLTGVRANQSTSPRHARCNPPSQLGDIRRHPRDDTSEAATAL